ncbi:MAG: CRISPR-associated helicase Cas3' [Aquificota bacterium]|nr:CRISPR-associated helicase Cas3' [Aquificota bacterium]
MRHNLLSPAFLPEDTDPFVRDLVSLAIIHHHDYEPDGGEVQKVREVLEKEFGKKLTYKELIKHREEAVIRKLASRKRLNENEVRKFYTLVKGLLLRIDHASSSRDVPAVETRREPSPEDKVERFLKEKRSSALNDLQRFVLENREDNLMVCASTGYGKTEAGFIFLKDKGFFTLPVRVSANAIYERAREVFGEEGAGLLHSSALLERTMDEKESNTDLRTVVLDHLLNRNFSKPLIVSTPDQILPFVFRHSGYEKIASLLAYSRVVVDEPQLFEPHTMGFLVKALEKIRELGGKVMVMSATLPPFVEEDLSAFEFRKGHFLTDKVRHNLKVIPRSVLDFTEGIKKLSERGKVLVIVNTVPRAVELKKALPDAGLLHAQFILKDRKEKEKRIKEFFEVEEKGVWITTQLAEVSLDLDADFLVTELSTVDSLLQRMGRVNRKGEKPADEPNVFILTEDCSGIGPVYRKRIHEESGRVLRDGRITEEEKLELLRKVYDRIQEVDPKYMEDYKRAKEFIESLWRTDLFRVKKKEAQELFRDIHTVTVIPETFREELSDLLREYSGARETLEKVRLLASILEYTMNVQTYRVKEFSLEQVEGIKGVFWLRADYSPETGLLEVRNGGNIL